MFAILLTLFLTTNAKHYRYSKLLRIEQILDDIEGYFESSEEVAVGSESSDYFDSDLSDSNELSLSDEDESQDSVRILQDILDHAFDHAFGEDSSSDSYYDDDSDEIAIGTKGQGVAVLPQEADAALAPKADSAPAPQSIPQIDTKPADQSAGDVIVPPSRPSPLSKLQAPAHAPYPLEGPPKMQAPPNMPMPPSGSPPSASDDVPALPQKVNWEAFRGFDSEDNLLPARPMPQNRMKALVTQVSMGKSLVIANSYEEALREVGTFQMALEKEKKKKTLGPWFNRVKMFVSYGLKTFVIVASATFAAGLFAAIEIGTLGFGTPLVAAIATVGINLIIQNGIMSIISVAIDRGTDAIFNGIAAKLGFEYRNRDQLVADFKQDMVDCGVIPKDALAVAKDTTSRLFWKGFREGVRGIVIAFGGSKAGFIGDCTSAAMQTILGVLGFLKPTPDYGNLDVEYQMALFWDFLKNKLGMGAKEFRGMLKPMLDGSGKWLIHAHMVAHLMKRAAELAAEKGIKLPGGPVMVGAIQRTDGSKDLVLMTAEEAKVPEECAYKPIPCAGDYKGPMQKKEKLEMMMTYDIFAIFLANLNPPD